MGLLFKQHAIVGHATNKKDIDTSTVQIILSRTERTDMQKLETGQTPYINL